MTPGKLYLIPSSLGEKDFDFLFPRFNAEIINSIDVYIVEDLRTGRRFLKKLGLRKAIDDLEFFLLNEHTQGVDLNEYLRCCGEGKNVGLMSDAGTPCIADPGNVVVVAKAHQLGVEVVPLIGPNSIVLALMGSGFNGQSFAFNGYLPVEQDRRESRLKVLESLVIKNNQTQLFIETPYRNNHLFQSILRVCQPDTRLCIACNMATDEQFLKSQSVARWRKEQIDLHKKPTVFVLGR